MRRILEARRTRQKKQSSDRYGWLNGNVDACACRKTCRVLVVQPVLDNNASSLNMLLAVSFGPGLGHFRDKDAEPFRHHELGPGLIDLATLDRRHPDFLPDLVEG